MIKDVLPKSYIQICFEKSDENENIRILNINLVGDRFENFEC